MAPNFTILITGGAGYVGSHTVVELLNAGHEVICVDNGSNINMAPDDQVPKSLKRVEELTGKSVTFYKLDIKDKEELDKVFKKHKVDCVGHFAAMKAVGESCQIPIKYYHNNITGTCILLEVMIENNVFNCVYSSSCTVYSAGQSSPFTENHLTGNCSSPYGRTKYICEELMKDVCSADERFNVISLRYFNPAGAHPSGKLGEDLSSEPTQLMPYICQTAAGIRTHVRVYGTDYPTHDGSAIRDYVHIVDLAEGHVTAMEFLASGKKKGFSVYNLGSGKGFSVLDIIKEFSKICGFDVPYELNDRRPGDIDACYSDPKLSAKVLNWVPKLGLKEICEDAWRWQNNLKNESSKKSSF